MATVYLLIRENCSEYAPDVQSVLGVFSTPEKATDAANEYIIKEWKENCENYSYRCPKTPLVYDDIHCKWWTFHSDTDDDSSIKIVDYNFDMLYLDR